MYIFYGLKMQTSEMFVTIRFFGDIILSEPFLTIYAFFYPVDIGRSS
jgi:hypothetical protein